MVVVGGGIPGISCANNLPLGGAKVFTRGIPEAFALDPETIVLLAAAAVGWGGGVDRSTTETSKFIFVIIVRVCVCACV